MAVASDRKPTALAPLGETIDVDALESIIQRKGGDSETDVEVSFVYEGYQIHVNERVTADHHE